MVPQARTDRAFGKYRLGGWGGIRTHEGRGPLPVFKTGPLNHSGTHPAHGTGDRQPMPAPIF